VVKRKGKMWNDEDEKKKENKKENKKGKAF